MLHSILQAASAHSFQGHHKSRSQQGAEESPTGLTEQSPPITVRTNSFLRPNSAYREKRLQSTRPDHRKDPRVAAQSHLERTVTKSSVVTKEDDDSKGKQDGVRTDGLKKGLTSVANGYSISSNVARLAQDRVLYTEGATIRPKPIINDIGDANQRTSSARSSTLGRSKPYIQVTVRYDVLITLTERWK